jgi:hypothetical protein
VNPLADITAPGTQGIPVPWRSLAYHGRHRSDEQTTRRDPKPDRLGAHHDNPEPFAREGAVPAAELITGEPT